MGVITQKTVGKILYQVIDDKYPIHNASKGTVCFTNDTIQNLYINIDGTNIWSPLIEPTYSDMDRTSSATLGAAITAYNWYVFSSGFVIQNSENTSGTTNVNIGPINPRLGKFWFDGASTINTTATELYQSWEIRIGSGLQQGCTQNTTNNYSYTCMSTMNIAHYNYSKASMSFRNTLSEGTQAETIIRDMKFSSSLIDVPKLLYEELWLQPSITGNSWIATTGQTNYWTVGAAGARSDSYGAFITNNGTDMLYTSNVASVSHIYKDFDLPLVNHDTYISFYVYVSGLTSTDYVEVYVAPTGVTPVAGSDLYNTYPEYYISWFYNAPVWTGYDSRINVKIQPNQTKIRMIFQWVNTGTLTGNKVSCAIDDIQIHTYYVNSANLNYSFYSDFETSLENQGWTVINDTTNKWVTGATTKQSGLASAYISNDNGTTAGYTNTTANVSHIYRDISAIPANAYDVRLEFYWRCYGQGTVTDFGAVYVVPTGTTPVAGTQLNVANRLKSIATFNTGCYNISKTEMGTDAATWVQEGINLQIDTASSGYTTASLPFRLVFSWRNDATTGTNPGFCIDNVKLTYKTN